jgi:hypothetical protein
MGLGGLAAGTIAAVAGYPAVFWVAAGAAAVGGAVAAAGSTRARGVMADIGFPP